MKLLILNSAKIETSVGKAIQSFCYYADQSFNIQVISTIRFNNTNAFKDEIEKWKKNDKKNIQTIVIAEKGFGDIKTLFSLYKIIREFKPDIVETSGYKMNILFYFIKSIIRCKWIVFFHGWTTENTKIKLYNIVDNLVSKRADKVLVVAKNVKDKLIASGYRNKQVAIINNAIDEVMIFSDENIKDFRNELKIPEHSFVISVIGRLSTEKGQLIFLKALNIINDKLRSDGRSKHIVALIVGDGPDKKMLKEYVKRNSHEHCIKFCGQRDEIGKFYQVSDLICIPSLSENLPYVLLESFQYKAPVLATSVGGIPELIKSGKNGLLVAPDDIKGLSEIIYKCICNAEILRSIRKILEIQELPEDFMPDQRAKKLSQVYNEVMHS